MSQDLDRILSGYQSTFTAKTYNQENNDTDVLMEAFGVTPELKRENRQYWGRELGKCWERLVVQVAKTNPLYAPSIQIGNDEPCDLVIGNYAIDIKYRLGSGDSGTLKKFKAYASTLMNLGFQPVLLIMREDNLKSAINACKSGGWLVLTGDESMDFIFEKINFNMKHFLHSRKNLFTIN